MRSTSSTSRSRSWLIAAQVALTLMLLTASTLLLRSFVQLRHVDLGFDAAPVLTADLRLAVGRFPDLRRPWFALGQHYDRVLQELAAVPGIESVSGVTDMPLTGEGTAGNFWMDDGSGVRPDSDGAIGSKSERRDAEYFATMGIPLVRGRSFAPADRLSEKALIESGRAKRKSARAAWRSSTRRSPNGSGQGRIPSDARSGCSITGPCRRARSSAWWGTCERPRSRRRPNRPSMCRGARFPASVWRLPREYVRASRGSRPPCARDCGRSTRNCWCRAFGP